jgi:glycosyltransferase involved in cell wall biosynthesis
VAGALAGCRFVIVGQRGWRYDDVLREAAHPALRGRVDFLGYVPEERLPDLYAHALATVYPSLYEGFGLPVVESMACGTPVLTSRSSSLAESGEGAALLADPVDEKALAEALHALATDASLRGRLRALGLERARAFTWERTGRETAAAYQEVYDEVRRRP